jgi:hypothetical protein
VLTHRNDLRGWNKQEVGSGGTMLVEQRAHGLFLADEHNLSRTVQLLGSQYGAIDGSLGGIIAPHCVQGYLHVQEIKGSTESERRTGSGELPVKKTLILRLR